MGDHTGCTLQIHGLISHGDGLGIGGYDPKQCLRNKGIGTLSLARGGYQITVQLRRNSKAQRSGERFVAECVNENETLDVRI